MSDKTSPPELVEKAREWHASYWCDWCRDASKYCRIADELATFAHAHAQEARAEERERIRKWVAGLTIMRPGGFQLAGAIDSYLRPTAPQEEDDGQ